MISDYKTKIIILVALLFTLPLLPLQKAVSKNKKPDHNSLKCRAKFIPGKYIRFEEAIGDLIIFYDRDGTFTIHRKLNIHYVKNRIEWLTECSYKLITLEIHDPILEGLDQIGYEVIYRITGIEGNTIHVYDTTEKRKLQYEKIE